MMADTMQRSENPHEQLVRELSEAASSTPRWIASASKLGQDRPAPRVDAAPRRPPARTIEWSALGEGSGAFARRGELVAELHEACTVEGGRTAANAPPVSIRARGSAIGADGAFALAQCLAVCAPLELVQLDVSKAALGDEGVHALASLFCTAHAPAVRVLTLSLAVNGLTSESGPALAAVIAPQARPLGGSDGGGRGVRELLLAHNTLGDSGCAHLAAGLARAGCGVTRLSLASNAIGDAGASALVDALPSVPSLTALDLSNARATCTRSSSSCAGGRRGPFTFVVRLMRMARNAPGRCTIAAPLNAGTSRAAAGCWKCDITASTSPAFTMLANCALVALGSLSVESMSAGTASGSPARTSSTMRAGFSRHSDLRRFFAALTGVVEN